MDSHVRLNAPCVLCGAWDSEVRYRLGEFRVEVCRRCGLAAINPRLPEEETARLYEHYFAGRGEIYPAMRPTISEMFWPPKPKLLLRACRQGASRATLGI